MEHLKLYESFSETPKEKAEQLIKDFGDISYKITEEIVMGLYDYGIREPKYWYDVQNEINNIIK